MIALDDADVRKFMWFSPDNNYKIIGHEFFNNIYYNPNNKLKIDEIFYQIAGVDFKNKWDAFYFQRNEIREKSVYDLLKLEGVKYNFIHDKEDKPIKPKNGLRNIRPQMEWMVWDYLKVIENAEEIHCLNSSFYCMIDMMRIQHPKMFLYQLKSWGEDMIGVLGSPWKIIR
jgi:hypothetical protein